MTAPVRAWSQKPIDRRRGLLSVEHVPVLILHEIYRSRTQRCLFHQHALFAPRTRAEEIITFTCRVDDCFVWTVSHDLRNVISDTPVLPPAGPSPCATDSDCTLPEQCCPVKLVCEVPVSTDPLACGGYFLNGPCHVYVLLPSTRTAFWPFAIAGVGVLRETSDRYVRSEVRALLSGIIMFRNDKHFTEHDAPETDGRLNTWKRSLLWRIYALRLVPLKYLCTPRMSTFARETHTATASCVFQRSLSLTAGLTALLSASLLFAIRTNTDPVPPCLLRRKPHIHTSPAQAIRT